MESNFNNRDFEQFVKQNADQYRMFPSEKVWKSVHNTLHTKRRWYGLGLAFLLLLTGGAVTLVMRSYPVSKKQDITAFKPSVIAPAELDEQTEKAKAKEIDNLLPFDRQPGTGIASGPVSIAESRYFEPSSVSDLISESPFTISDARSFEIPAIERREENIIINSAGLYSVDPAAQSTATVSSKEGPAKSAPLIASLYEPTNVDFNSPLTIESVLNSFKGRPKHVSWQLFVTPTISYRHLGENKDISGSSNYPFASLSNVNKAVTHKPDLGLQIGFMGRYPVSKSVRIRGGLQFNINRYDIKAFVYPGEVAIINLDGGVNNTVSTWTNYRSQSGYKSDWLKNFYFSVSLPLGIEYQVAGNKKTSVGIAGTIQPTYIIRDRAYLISTDYKNYAEVPWLIRHVNMSTGFETFVSYAKGKTKWQVGPQVRYQLLSSFQNKYPVKEHLFDFGIKVGVTLNN